MKKRKSKSSPRNGGSQINATQMQRQYSHGVYGKEACDISDECVHLGW